MPTILNLQQAETAFNLLNANQSRLFLTLNIIVIENKSHTHNQDIFIKEVRNFARKTDVVFTIDNVTIGLLLLESVTTEAIALCERLFMHPFFHSDTSHFVACTANVLTDLSTFETIISHMKSTLHTTDVEKNTVLVEEQFNMVPITDIKISIIVADPLFAKALNYALQALAIEHFELEIEIFDDGSDFLSSDFYYSAHRHIVLLDDILPRQNGMEVLHYIRHLPNARKFSVIMLSDRNAEEHATLAYEHGVDNYLLKPINHQLLMALIKRMLKRLWD